MRLAALCAVCATVVAAFASPRGEVEARPAAASLNATKPAESSTLSRLEALVGQLYNLQSSRAERSEAAPAAEPVVILDDESARRSLQGNCMCDSYLSGASASSSSLCGKEEAGRIVCRMGTPTCPSDMTPCGGGGAAASLPSVEELTPQARASPNARGPSELEFLDAETSDDHFVNVNFEVSSTATLPSADALQAHLATMLDVPAKRVTLQLVPNQIAAANQATVQATITTHSTTQENEAKATLAAMNTLALDAATVDVQRVGFHPGSSSALVCNDHAERLKRQIFEDFSRYLDLKTEELNLLQELADDAANPSTGCSSCAPIQQFAAHMGLSRR